MTGHVFLVGFMGSGKSTVARLLATDVGLPCIDLDTCIEAEFGTTVAEVFSSRGEDAFRDIESACLATLADEPRSVVACGGGVVLRPENRTLLHRLGTVVYLEVTPAEAMARVGDVSTRPLLAGGGARLAETLLDARVGLYRSVADITIDTVGFEAADVAHAIARQLRERGLA